MISHLDTLDELMMDNKDVWTTAELREHLGSSPQSTSNLLARWLRDGLVDRVSRGRYVIRPLGMLGTRAASQDVALAVAAAFRGIPHRIAFRSALDYHGLLVHPARTIQVASTRRRSLTTISGRRLVVVSEPESTISKGIEVTAHGANVSNHLRSLIDVAGRPDLAGGPAVLAEALRARPADPSKLEALAAELNAGPALRRIGSIADQLELVELAGQLEPLARSHSDLRLDTRDEARAFRDGRWNVSWPITPAELAASVEQ